MVNGEIKLEILRILEDRNYGLTIEEISSILNINRSTASRYLAIMEAEGNVLVREVGKAKLHYPKNEMLEILINGI